MKDGVDMWRRFTASSKGARSRTTTGTGQYPVWPHDNAVRRGIFGTVLARPWFDDAALFFLRHMFFPASRLFAVADEARGDIARFAAAVPLPARRTCRRRLERLLARIERARATSKAVDSAWERVFFGGEATDEAERVAIEAARIKARHDLNSLRWTLRFSGPWNVPAARLAVETPASVAALLDGRAAFDACTELPAAMPDILVSQSIPTAIGTDYWLRFQSPYVRVGDVVTARVHEPHGVVNPPTIIFGHGVCVDFDHWLGLIDESVWLVSLGFRVIRPEAPWHGRRTPRGYFAGERTISSFPMGIIDSMIAAVIEWSVLAYWARKRSTGPLAFGGSSLGAMTAQLSAGRSARGPGASRPDALFLVTHAADMTAVVLDGALSSLWAHPEQASALGWTTDLARQYLSLLDAPTACPVDPGHVVSIIGRRDTVLPFASGRRQLTQWGVPEANIFEWDRGHFTVPATMIRTREPMERLARIMSAMQDHRRRADNR
jgi:hypothetical protein